MTHVHPDSPDYLLLDKVVRDLDGKLGADLLPIDVAVKGLDLEALVSMAHIRARKVAEKSQDVSPHAGLFAAYMDGFTAGVMYQRAKDELA